MRKKVFEKVFIREMMKFLEESEVWDKRDYELIVHGAKMALLSMGVAVASSASTGKAPSDYEAFKKLYESIKWD